MKHFEAFIGSQWTAWVENEKTKITKKVGVVTVDFENPEGRKFKTTINLDNLQAYTFSV